MLQVPFVIYADFEAYSCKIQGPANTHAATMPYELHELSGCAYHVVCRLKTRLRTRWIQRTERGGRIHRSVEESKLGIHKISKDVVPKKLTEDEERSFRSADNCHLCDELLGANRARDHCHLTGKYPEAAYSECNLQLQYKSDKRSNRSVFVF